MAEALLPIAFRPDLGVLKTRLSALATLFILFGAVTLLSIYVPKGASPTVLFKARVMAAIGPPLLSLIVIAALFILLRMVRNRPVLTILPEGLCVPLWGRIPWKAIQSVEVAWVSGPKLALKLKLLDLRALSRSLPWHARLLLSGRDWSAPLILPQSDFDTPLPTIAAAIEAHRPKAPTP